MKNTTIRRFHRHAVNRFRSRLSRGSGSSHLSRYTVLLTALLLLTLATGPLLSTGVLQAAPVAAQSADSTTSVFNTSAGPVFTLPAWSNGASWDHPEHYTTIQLADIDGDGGDELLGRGYDGMMVYKWNATLGLWNEVSTSGPFTNPQGWIFPYYYSTIQTADIDGDGAAELLARSASGVETYKWDQSQSSWTLLRTESPAWSDTNGFDHPQYYETIQTADIDGDGAAELLGRGVDGMDTYKWNGSEWTLLKSADPDWSDAGGWDKAEYYTTIQTADIDGEKGDELLARGAGGMDTYKWTGSEWKFLKSSSPPFSDAAGWNHPQYYLTIQTADIDGDGAAEMLARSGGGMETFKWNGTAWGHLKSEDPEWTDKGGWDQSEYYTTIQTGDLDGDGTAELLARAADGMDTYKWEDGSWVSLVASYSPQLTNEHWSTAENYRTIQTGDVDGDNRDDLVARGIYGIRTWSFDKVIPNNWDNPVAFGFPAFSDVEMAAFDFINAYLDIESGQTIRDQYTTDANTLDTYKNCLLSSTNDNQWVDWTALPTDTCIRFGNTNPIQPPSELTLAAWNNVSEQIFDELGRAQSVSDYFSGLSTLYSGIFTDDSNILSSTAEKLYGEDMADKQVDALFQELFLAPFALSSLGGDVSAAAGGFIGALIGAGLDAASSDSFQGTWADAQKKFTELSESNKSSITNGRAFVASDASLLTYVAQQKDSGAWDPSDAWVTRSTTSEGRKQFALWIFQTLSPSIWQFQVMYYVQDDMCVDGSWPDTIQYYFVNKNDDHDCYRAVVTNDFSRNIAPASPLENILDPVTSACTPTQDNTATWEYGICTLGIEKSDFFLNRNGWNFKLFPICESIQGCDTSSTAVAADVAPGDPDNTIDLNHQGSVDVALLGSAEFDATSTDHASLQFAGASPVGWWVDQDDWHPTRIRDVNDDGYLDAVASFAVSDLQLTGGETTALLTGSAETTRFRLELPVRVLPVQ